MTSTGKSKLIPAAVAALSALTALPGCFTGIERTAVIKDTSAGRHSHAITPEDTLLATVRAALPFSWNPGKPFIVADNRLELAYSPAAEARKLTQGDTLRLHSIGGTVRLSGDSVSIISLRTPGGTMLTHEVESAPTSLLARDAGEFSLPFLIDPEMIDRARNILRGRRLWTLTNTRYDATTSEPVRIGLKFAPVEITDVTAGTPEYPFHVIFKEQDGSKSMLLMVPGSRTSTARTFNNLFSLSDPREKYPEITDEKWALICRADLTEGMTRQEARLSLGTPTDVDRETTYAGIIERWTYPGGTYLIFTDGILSRFRR